MNKNILTFVLGFISGSAATVIFAKKYYEKVANDEIEQVKETYARKAEIEEAGKIDEDLKAVDKVIKEHQYNTVTDEEPKETAEDKKGPYVIQPEQFCDCDYTPMTLWYWTDGEVTNDDKKIVANVDELIGDVDEVTSYFGEYENDPDTVYVRNDIQRIDYEILKEYRAFSDLNSDIIFIALLIFCDIICILKFLCVLCNFCFFLDRIIFFHFCMKCIFHQLFSEIDPNVDFLYETMLVDQVL